MLEFVKPQVAIPQAPSQSRVVLCCAVPVVALHLGAHHNTGSIRASRIFTLFRRPSAKHFCRARVSQLPPPLPHGCSPSLPVRFQGWAHRLIFVLAATYSMPSLLFSASSKSASVRGIEGAGARNKCVVVPLQVPRVDSVVHLQVCVVRRQRWYGAGGNSGSTSIFRTFRLLRVLKLMKSIASLRLLLLVVLQSLKNVASMAFVFFLFVFMFALVGMQRRDPFVFCKCFVQAGAGTSLSGSSVHP
jgi:hypothetical protein